MQQFVILTDSSCDLPAELAQQLQLEVVPLSVTVEEDTYKNYLDGREISAKAFYDKIREGKKVFTSAVNINTFIETMEPLLQQGKDVLYLGFSSGLAAPIVQELLPHRSWQKNILSERFILWILSVLPWGRGCCFIGWYSRKMQEKRLKK